MAMSVYLDSDHAQAAAVEAEKEEECNLFRCTCCWRKYCRPHVPRYAPGQDVYIPRAPSDAAAAGDDHPTWSVLVGCLAAKVPFHNLRLHRFRVAASGRVLGRTDDMLEPVVTVSPPGDGTTFVANASATLAAGGGLRLYGCYMQQPGFDGALARSAADLPPALAPPQLPHRAFAVDVDPDADSLRPSSSPPPPPLPFFYGTYMAVWAHGQLWAPAIVDVEEDVTGLRVRLVMHRLDPSDNTWREAASVDMRSADFRRHLILRGYAVIGDRLVLLSLSDSTFFCFDCAAAAGGGGTGTFTPVKTAGAGGKSSSEYSPFCGKAVAIGDGGDGMVVYYLRLAKLFAYRLSKDEEGKLFVVAPPVEVDRLWPYYEEGCGKLVHLAGRMLCAVWMNVHLPCGCAQRHALITTFLVRGGDGGGGDDVSVDVLHSTCRRVDMLRSEAVPRWKSLDALCFLQEYPNRAGSQVDVDPTMMVPAIGSSPTMMADGSHQQVGVGEDQEITDDMPDCCRVFFSGGVPILKECSSVVTKPDFYFICQAHDFSHVYQINVARGKLTCHDQMLQPHLSLDTFTPGVCGVDEPPAWHFVQQSGSNDNKQLYVIPSDPAQNHYEVDVSSKLYNVIELERPGGASFSVVSRAGQHIVALGDTLQDVYVLDKPALKWIPLVVTSSSSSSGPVDLTRKVNITGFVDLVHDDVLVVSDADVAGCFLLDLRKKEWFVMEPPPGLWQSVEGVLCGRCLFAEGFIYTCTSIGFAAFELLKADAGYGLGWPPVLMEFPHVEFFDRKLVSFDLICKDVGHLVLCLVEGSCVSFPFSSHHSLFVTTVEVKLQEMARGRKVPVRIDHIDISDSRVDHKGWIWTSHAFSL